MKRSSLAAMCAALSLLGTTMSASSAAAVTGTTTVSFRNTRVELPDAVYRAQLQAAKALGCQPAFPPGVAVPPGFGPAKSAPKRVTFAVALATATQVAGLTPARRTALRALAMSKTVVGTERLAAVGVMNRDGNGALASLIVGASLQPRDPLPLIDAAAILVDAGKPNEALAFLDQAQTLPQRKLTMMGINTIAILETNRAAALFRTTQYVAAAAAAQRALTSSKWLVEARENRAMALLCLNKTDEAICEFREAEKRPLEAGEEHLTCTASRATKPGDYDYKIEQAGVYPPIGYAPLPSKAPGYVDYIQRLNAETGRLSKIATDNYNAFILKVNAPNPKRSSMSRIRGADIFAEMLRVPLRPAYVAQMASAQALEDDIGKLATDTTTEMVRIVKECAPSEQCTRDRCRTLLEQNHPVFLNRQTQIETIVRAWWKDLHAEMAGYAQGLGDPDENAAAVASIDEEGLIGWNLIQQGPASWNGVPASLRFCFDPPPDPPVADPGVGPDGSPRNPCPPALDKLKAKFDLGSGKVESGPFQGASVSAGVQVKCSEVSVSTSATWSPLTLLSGFGKMTYATNAQGGTLTIGIGSKASLGPADFQSGLQLTVKQHWGGTNVDLAWKVGPSLGPKSDVVDISIFKSVAPPQASPTFQGP